ncbi:MAG: hypothetical protein ACJ77K_12595 [Bacteroidia bacterium]
MKRSTLILLSVLLLSFGTSAQCTWHTVGDTVNFSVKSLLDSDNGTFLAGGTFTKIGSYSIAGIAQWDGGTWTAIAGSGIYGTEVHSLVAYGNGYVAGGTFSMIDSVYCNNIGYYDGVEWYPLGSGLNYTGGITVSTLVVHNGDLYAAGNFISSGSTALNHIAKWNGSTWVPLGSGINGTVNALCSYDGKLYAAGTFNTAGGVSVNNIAAWDGTSWTNVNGGVNSYTGGITVSTLSVFQDELYVGGNFTMAGADSISNIARWNDSDSTWSSLGGGLQYTGAITVSTISIAEVNKSLIVSGSYKRIGDNKIVYELQSWDGINWTVLDGETNKPIQAMASVNDALLIGGDFRGVGSATQINYLGTWACGGGKMMTVLTQAQQPEKQMFRLYPNPVIDNLHMNLYPEADKMREDPFSFTLSDVTGRKLRTVVLKGDDLKIERAGIPAGLYYYEVKNLNTGNIQKGKVIFK